MGIWPLRNHQSAFGCLPEIAVEFGLLKWRRWTGEKKNSKEKPACFFFLFSLYLLMLMMLVHLQRGHIKTNMTHAYRKKEFILHFTLPKSRSLCSFYTVYFHLKSTMPARKKESIRFFLFLLLFYSLCPVCRLLLLLLLVLIADLCAAAFGLHLKSNLFLLWKPVGNGTLCPHWKPSVKLQSTVHELFLFHQYFQPHQFI